MTKDNNGIDVEMVKDLWELGAEEIQIGSFWVKFRHRLDVSDEDIAKEVADSIPDKPADHYEPGWEFFFKQEFFGPKHIKMTDQEARYVKELLEEDAAEIVQKYLNKVRYGQ